MDTPPNSVVMKVSDNANQLLGCRLKEPPTKLDIGYPEPRNLEKRTLTEDDRSTCRPLLELPRRYEGPAAAVPHSLARPTCGIVKQLNLH